MLDDHLVELAGRKRTIRQNFFTSIRLKFQQSDTDEASSSTVFGGQSTSPRQEKEAGERERTSAIQKFYRVPVYCMCSRMLDQFSEENNDKVPERRIDKRSGSIIIY